MVARCESTTGTGVDTRPPTASPCTGAPVAASSLGAGLELNAIALMATSGMTAMFGLVFWASPRAGIRGRAVVGADLHRHDDEHGGRARGGPRLRPVPGFGQARGRAPWVLVRIRITAAAAAVLGGAFVLFFADDALFSSWTERAAFPVLVVVLALFALQDWVLIPGFRQRAGCLSSSSCSPASSSGW